MSSEGPAANPVGAAPLLNNRYELGERLAEGSFFNTYRGRDVQTNRPVAIKVLRQEFAADEVFAGKLLAESESAIHLRHPNIAQVYDVWRERGTVVIVTEWVRGINLKDRITRVAPFPLAVSVDILLACAEALNYAHQNGFTHGDVRPDNIIITSDGRVKLTDFGVGVSVAASTRHQMNALAEAVYYMAPELAGGRVPDASSDIYSLGCVLYEMLTGDVPYDAETPLAIAVKHLNEPVPSPKKLNPVVPPAVDGVTRKALQKSPEARYGAFDELLRDVHAVRDAIRDNQPLTWSPLEAEETVAKKQKTRAAQPRPRPAEREAPVTESDGGPSAKLLAALALLAVLLVVGSFFLAMVFTGAPPQVSIPAGLIGKSEAEARMMLQQVGLKAETSQDYRDGVPAGKVYGTLPPTGTQMRAGKTVKLLVSMGAQPVNVPDVVGKQLSAAQKALQDSGLVLGQTTEQYSEVVAKGEVISQVPGGDETATRKSKVDLIVSKGPEPVPTVDNVDVNGSGGNAPGGNGPDTGPDEFPQMVTIEVPADARGPQRVKVTVKDRDGEEQTSYEEDHQPGEKVEVPVVTHTKTGQDEIRIYLNDKPVDPSSYVVK